MAIDPEAITLASFWTTAEARSASGRFASLIKPNNRVKTSRAEWVRLIATRSGPADFPCLLAFGTGGTEDDVTTFATGEAGAPDFGVPMVVRFDLVLAFDPMKASDAVQSPVKSEVRATLHQLVPAMRAAGYRWAGPIKVNERSDFRSFTAPGTSNRTQRPITTFSVSITCRPLRSELVS